MKTTIAVLIAVVLFWLVGTFDAPAASFTLSPVTNLGSIVQDIVNNNRGHITIQLEDGTYLTDLYSEQHPEQPTTLLIKGDNVTLKAIHPGSVTIMPWPKPTMTNGQLAMLWAKGRHDTVSGINFDCGQYYPNSKKNGLIFIGNHSKCQDLNITNFYGNKLSGDEAFGILYGGTNGDGNVIERCTVSPNIEPDALSNAYDNCISPSGYGLLVRDVKCIMPQTNSWNCGLVGINLYNVTNGLVENFTVIGGGTGIYHDTGPMVGITIRDGWIMSAPHSIWVYEGALRSVTGGIITDNHIWSGSHALLPPVGVRIHDNITLHGMPWNSNGLTNNDLLPKTIIQTIDQAQPRGTAI